jgi:PAS domain S-box-containing protein
LKLTSAFDGKGRDLASAARNGGWTSAVGWSVVIGTAYFLTSRLGLSLLVPPSDVAVFWPASGIGAGILIAFGRRAFTPLAIGIIVGAVAANLLSDRSLATAVLKGFCNIGEPVIVAWLLQRWFGPAFAFSDLRRVLGFLAAAAIGTATSAIGGAATITLLHTTAPFWDVWRVWLLSDGIGIVVVAPLIIELRRAAVEPPSWRDTIEGAAVLTVVGALAIYVFAHPTESWISFDPDAFILPLLLWLAARWPAPFAIAGAFVVSAGAISTTTFGIGHLSDVLPVIQRVHGVQMTVVMVTVFTLVFVALFRERRSSEETLKQSKDRLHLALDGAELGAFSANLVTGQFECDVRTALMHGHHALPSSIKEARQYVHRGDRLRIGEALAEAFRGGRSWNAEYRVVHPRGHAHAGETRWVTLESSVLRDPRGTPVGLLGVTRDITVRKRTEDSLAERNAQLALAGKAALVGTYAYDPKTRRFRVTEGFVALYGLPENTTEIPLSQWQARVHSQDLRLLEAVRDQAYRERRREYTAEFRIVRDGEVRWIEARKFIKYDADGHPKRVVGVNIDVTTRKKVEEQQRALVGELDHRVKNVLATVSAVVGQTLNGSSSMSDFAAALNGRIQSMARTHELLSASRWRGISVAEIIQRELAPYIKDGNTEIDGPEVVLRAETGQVMAMVVHELATNAAKYGALSTQQGRVSIRWGQSSNGHRYALVFEWRETGGPPVVAPQKSGYGTSTIRDVIPYEFAGAVDLTFAASGVKCRIELPADWLSHDGEPTWGASETQQQAGTPELSYVASG